MFFASVPVALRKVARVVVLAIPILAAMVTAIVLLALVLAAIRGTEVSGGDNVALACLCVLIAGTFVTVFHVRRETVALPLKNHPTLMEAAKQVLEELGYEVVARSPDQLTSRPSFRALLFGGRIQVSTRGNEARINGPRFFVEILRRRLRLRSHIANAAQMFKDGRGRERLLKRVHIGLRFAPQQWEEVGRMVVEQLAVSGADVYCEVQIMAQSETGIRESLVEGEIHQWLRDQGMEAELHKDHARWEETLPDVGVEFLEKTQS